MLTTFSTRESKPISAVTIRQCPFLSFQLFLSQKMFKQMCYCWFYSVILYTIIGVAFNLKPTRCLLRKTTTIIDILPEYFRHYYIKTIVKLSWSVYYCLYFMNKNITGPISNNGNIFYKIFRGCVMTGTKAKKYLILSFILCPSIHLFLCLYLVPRQKLRNESRHNSSSY